MPNSPQEAVQMISTHSAREDGDRHPWHRQTVPPYFNPLRPRGRRQNTNGDSTKTKADFNPLRPRGRRRRARLEENCRLIISTHSAREDGDSQIVADRCAPADFNPLRPRGRRRLQQCDFIIAIQFQPTPPARTETNREGEKPKPFTISTHSAREDGDVRRQSAIGNLLKFQPTPPARTETMACTKL